MSIEPDTEPLWIAQSGNNSMTNLTQPEASSSQQPSQQQQQQRLPAQTTNASIFSFAFYSDLFDVDTKQVLGRCLLALNPFSQARFFAASGSEGIIGSGYGEEKPDLYGPFWISTTVIFALFFSSSLTGVFYSMYKGVNYEYKFEVLSGAAMILYSYTFLWPVLLYLIIRNVITTTATQESVSLVKLCCIFGYSNVIWIPVAILAVSPLAGAFPNVADLVRWLVVGFGYIFSAIFLLKNLKPILVSAADEEESAVNADPEARKQGFFLLGLIALLHVALAISIKYLFFGSLKELSK
jgi:hypothetical protein